MGNKCLLSSKSCDKNYCFCKLLWVYEIIVCISIYIFQQICGLSFLSYRTIIITIVPVKYSYQRHVVHRAIGSADP